MPIDGYSLCPGGLGKKIKFCCADLVTDLAKIERMREGEQTTACLDLVERLDAKQPGRACLLAAKADLLRELGRKQDAEAAVRELMEKSGPANPVALSEASLLAAQEGETVESARLFQQALSCLGVDDPWPDTMFLALPTLAIRLVNDGYWLAARAHLSLQLALNPEDRAVIDILLSLNQSPGLPLLFKYNFELETCAETTPWQAEFNQAVDLGQRARWLEAADKFSALQQRGVNDARLWRNLAILRSRVADDDAAAEAWHKFAASKVPLDDAIEAETMAQLLDPQQDEVETLRIRYPVADLERFHEVLLSDSRLAAVKELPPGSPDEPPPKASFNLLSQACPATGVGLQIEASPRVIGSAMLYGKQTDREARLELFCWRPEVRTAAAALLAELGFGMLGAPDAGEVVDRTSLDAALLEADYLFPSDTPVDTRFELTQAVRRRAVFNDWPRMPRQSLGGQSPAQAAGDPSRRVAVWGALLRFQMQCESIRMDVDFDALRAQLKLPLPEPIVLGNADLEDLSPARLSRLVMSQLSDEQLKGIAPLGRMLSVHIASAKACRELLSRLGDKEPLLQAELLTILAAAAGDSRESLALVDRARELAVKAKRSSGEWDLMELRLRGARGEGEHFNRLLQHLVAEHMNEPHVRQEVTQLLVQMGVIRPDGTPVRQAAPTVMPADAPGKLWTPDSAKEG